MDLASLGWNDFFEASFRRHATKEGMLRARVASEHKHAYVLMSGEGLLQGVVLGRLLKDGPRAALPVVGDWVIAEKRLAESRVDIHRVLDRKTRFSRRAAGGREEEQVIAANLDTIFLVNGLDADFSPRRLERYLALSKAGGAQPVVLLNKSDLCRDVEARLGLVRQVAGSVPVHALSATQGEGLASLEPYLQSGKTVALLGSSGVGKSTLVNRLLGRDRQEVRTTRDEDGKGRHTTTRRELIGLPGGALLIDTPGMRELQLWSNAREGLAEVFPEIVAHAAACRFRDCRHEREPGCAVRAAVEDGAVARERLAAFFKLRAELEALNPGEGSRGRTHVPKIKGRRIMRG